MDDFMAARRREREEEEEEEFPDCHDTQELPIEKHKIKILKHIRDHRVTCLEAETGSGKSTKVPQYIVEFCNHAIEKKNWDMPPPRVVVTQPRRLAAKSLTSRVARAMGSEVGDRVGYRIGQEQVCGPDTEILFVTAGYLIQHLVHDPKNLLKFTHIVLDEVHERSLDSDFLSLIIKTLMQRPEAEHVKLIVMSATLETTLFSKYFGEITGGGGTEVLHVGSNAPYHVEELYLEDVIQRYHEELPPSVIGNLLVCMAALHRTTPKLMLADEDNNMEQVVPVIKMLLAKKAIKPSILAEVPKSRDVLGRLLRPAIDIIRITAEPERSVLVFLPGQGTIENMFDMLRQFEENDCTGPDEQFPWKARIRVFALYRKIPYNDQKECFQSPPPGVSHIILATNIAESSITFPQVSVILDFGKRKTLKCGAHRGKRLQMLVEEWCSQASMKQRKGRTGRVCDGMCIRFMTQNIYENQKKYDDPEMLYAPLDKLFLQVKFAGDSIVPGMRPSQWLESAIQGPDLSALEQTVQCLADADALQEADENSAMTLLGRAIMSLPLDVRLCRIVFYGVLLGCPCDAAVMAASLQVEDPFTCPSRKIIKDNQRFIDSLRHSLFDGRWQHDGREYSEPIMILNMYKEWLYVSSQPAPNPVGVKKHFCHENGVMMKRLNTLENTVAEVMQTVVDMLQRGTQQDHYGKMKELLEYLPRPKRYNPHATTVTAAGDKQEGQVQLERYFTRDSTMLKAVLVAALCPMFVFGHASATDKPDCASIQMPEDAKIAANDDALVAVLKGLSPDITEFIPGMLNDIKVTVKGDCPADGLRDVSRNMHGFLQCCEGREYFTVRPPHGFPKSKMLRLKAPSHESKLKWELISAEGQALKVFNKAFEAQLDWRNPVGNACKVTGGWCLAVAHEYKTVAHEERGSRRRELVSKANVSGVTMLPTEHDNLLAVALVLTFLPRYLRDTVHYDYRKLSGVVTCVHLLQYKLSLTRENPLTTRLMRQILDIQAEVQKVQEVMQQPQDERRDMSKVVVIESDIPQLMDELFQLIRK